MWSTSYVRDIPASADRLFALFADVANWKAWNAGVDSIEMNGPFEVGATAVMVMPDGERLPFTIVWVVPGRGFEDETPLPDVGALVRVRHELEPRADGSTRVTYTCTVDGPDDVGAEIGPMVSGDFPDVLKSLAEYATR